MINETYTPKEVAAFMKVSTRTVARWIEKGLLKVIKVNGVTRITKEEFTRFLDAHK